MNADVIELEVGLMMSQFKFRVHKNQSLCNDGPTCVYQLEIVELQCRVLSKNKCANNKL